MRRWHEDLNVTRAHWREHLKIVHDWPRKPLDCECELQVGRFRKIGGPAADQAARIAGPAGLAPALDKAAHCPGSGANRLKTSLEKNRWKCSIPIAAWTATSAAWFA